MDILVQESAILRCKAGDKEAFRLLAEEYEKLLFGIAYLMIHNREIAEDIVQDTLLKMWTHIHSLRDPKRFKTWLIRILVNEVKKQYRKKHLPVMTIEEAYEIHNNLNETIVNLEQDDIHKKVRQAIRILPTNQRNTVILRYFGELTVDEVAIIMGCRKGTVKSRLSRALDQLQTILEKNGIREVI